MNAPQATAEHDLEHSRPIDFGRTVPPALQGELSGHFVSQLEALEQRARARKADDRRRLEATLSAIILDLFAAWEADPELFLAIPLDRNAYVQTSRYQRRDITYAAAKQSVEFLSKAGYAVAYGGYINRGVYGGLGTIGRRTRIRATEQLVEVLKEGLGLTLDDLARADSGEIILLRAAASGRGKAKPLVEYDDTPETIAMRDRLERVNALLATTAITLRAGSPGDIDRNKVRLYRVFNNGSFRLGGRFYGGWWQELPKAKRAELLINGEPTVELDFASHQPRICYHLAGAPLGREANPYLLQALPDPALREVTKRLFGQLVNRSGGDPRQPRAAKHLLPKGWTWKDIVAAFEAQHAPIQKWFQHGRGLRLQAIDAEIADAVLHALAMRGIPCLPIHDSFIVPRSAEAALGEAMILAYDGQLGKRTRVKALPVIKGWSSPEIEASLIDRLSPILGV